jgi:hypothetical protein
MTTPSIPSQPIELGSLLIIFLLEVLLSLIRLQIMNLPVNWKTPGQYCAGLVMMY